MNKFLDLGNLIRSARQLKKFSQKDLANLLNISSQLLYKYESNLSRPSIETLFNICYLLDIKLDPIITSFSEKNKFSDNSSLKLKEMNMIMIFSEVGHNEKKFVQSHQHSILQLRRKFLKINSSKHINQLLEINKKMITKSEKELSTFNKLFK